MSENKRKEKDVLKLLQSEYKIDIWNDNMSEFTVIFKGPDDSPYSEGIWKVLVHLPKEYPFKSPSIGFLNKIYHPNIQESSGSVCLDVINQAWSPMYELKNVFDIFLPQLLLYPNPKDPLNVNAAKLYLNDWEKYDEKVKDFVKKYGNLESVKEDGE